MASGDGKTRGTIRGFEKIGNFKASKEGKGKYDGGKESARFSAKT